MRGGKPLVVIGGGPVGLLCALRGRQLGWEVEVHARGLPSSKDPPRVECAPAGVVALLVEFGVNPKRIGVDALHRKRVIQWSGPAVESIATPDVAHIGRPGLEIALLEIALSVGAKINTAEATDLEELRRRHRAGECVLLDASGRAAVTATRRVGPERPLVARIFHGAAQPGLLESALMIAAGPEGYAYRLANATTLTVGVVGRQDFVRGDSRQVLANIAGFAPWLVRDLEGEPMGSGASGAASAQWTRGDDGLRVGDASFARDALGSQGLALGLSDSLKACLPASQVAGAPSRSIGSGAISAHCGRVAEQIRGSAFRAAPMWTDYLRFLSDVATRSSVAEGLLVGGPGEHR